MKQLDTYNFTLILANVDDRTPGLEDQLYEAGCDDALINFREGTVILDFSREASSLEEALFSAIHAVESIPAEPKVSSVLPDDLVTAAEIAKRLNVERQTVSLWVKRARRHSHCFPHAVSQLASKSPMWRWYEVVKWLMHQGVIQDKEMLASAKLIENLNAALTERDSDIHAYRQQLLARLSSNR